VFQKIRVCSAAEAFPNSDAGPPLATQVPSANWYRPQWPEGFQICGLPPDSRLMMHDWRPPEPL